MREKKMSSQFFLMLVLSLVEVINLEKADEHDFAIVSTSQLPPEDDGLSELEKQLKPKNKHFKKIQIATSALTHLTNQLIKLTEENRRLEEQFQNRLENINLNLASTNLPSWLQSTKGLPRDCKEVKERGNKASKIYRIQPESSPKPFSVFCNMDVRGGGWTYVLKRSDKSQDFKLSWSDYKNGFGDLEKEFWIGLDHLYQLTGNEVNELLIQLFNENNRTVYKYTHYNNFTIGNEAEGYTLKNLGSYSGDSWDSLSLNIGFQFTTNDRDQDGLPDGNCASLYGGGWWYKDCKPGHHLTGKFNFYKEVWMMVKRRDL